MGPQHFRARVLRLELIHDPAPKQTCRPQLGRFHEEIHTDGKEKTETARKLIDIHAPRDGGTHVLATIRQSECQLLNKVRAGLLHVVARDRNRVKLRHVIRGIFNDISDDPHRRFRRIYVGVPNHEFLQNVVLNGPRKQRPVMALFFSSHDEACKDRNDRAVHRHRHADLIKRNTVKEDFHVLDTINGDPGFPDIPLNARMVAVITPMRRQIECHTHTLLTRSQIASIERV